MNGGESGLTGSELADAIEQALENIIPYPLTLRETGYIFNQHGNDSRTSRALFYPGA